jgi:hypothetical protein
MDGASFPGWISIARPGSPRSWRHVCSQTNLGDRYLEQKNLHMTFHAIEPSQGSKSTNTPPSPFVIKRLHTSSLRLSFEHTGPGVRTASPQLSRALRSYRARDLSSTQQSPSPPEFVACQGPQMKNPQLVTSYYDPHRHSSVPFSACWLTTLRCCRFPPADAPEHVGYA